MRAFVLSSLLLLAACADWPDAGGPPMARSAQDWPELLPLDALLRTSQVPPASEDENDALLQRAAALRNRAAILRGSANDMDALRRRLAE